MNEKRVRDIMSFSSLVEVGPESSIKEVVTASLPALRAGYSPTIVVKDGDKIIGMACWNDVLGALVPAYAKGKIKMEIFWEGLFTEQWHAIAGEKIKKLIRPPVFVALDDTLMKVAYKLVNDKINSVLVKDQGKLVGVISTGDLFNELLQCSA